MDAVEVKHLKVIKIQQNTINIYNKINATDTCCFRIKKVINNI